MGKRKGREERYRKPTMTVGGEGLVYRNVPFVLIIFCVDAAVNDE